MRSPRRPEVKKHTSSAVISERDRFALETPQRECRGGLEPRGRHPELLHERVEGASEPRGCEPQMGGYHGKQQQSHRAGHPDISPLQRRGPVETTSRAPARTSTATRLRISSDRSSKMS